MNLIEHTVGWLRSEIVEHATIGALGLAVVVIAVIVNWKYGTLPATRAMILSFLIVGALFSVMGASGSYVNNQRIATFEQRYQNDPVAFLHAEDLRTANFLSWYRYTLAAGFILIIAGLALFAYSGSPTARGINLALMLVGFGGLLTDNVSEANAKHYRAAIEMALDAAGDIVKYAASQLKMRLRWCSNVA